MPNQKHEKLSKQITDHIHDVFKKVQSPNKIVVKTEEYLDPWYEDHLHWNYEAANLATKQVIYHFCDLFFNFINFIAFLWSFIDQKQFFDEAFKIYFFLDL